MHDPAVSMDAGRLQPGDIFQDLVQVTKGAIDQRLARRLVSGSAGIADWLNDNGVRLKSPESTAMPYSERTDVTKENPGFSCLAMLGAPTDPG